MSAPGTLYLVDGTYLLFRAFHSLPTSLAVAGPAYQKNRGPLIELLRRGTPGCGADPPGVADPTLAWLEDAAHDRMPTNAVRGLVSVLLKIMREEKPTSMAVAFDLPGKVHRDTHYESFVASHPDYAKDLEGYKATRPDTPIEIHVQYPLARIACWSALGIPILEAVDFEADDLIGTVACWGRSKGFTVRLVTADKDLFQLVQDDILILNPHKSPTAKPGEYLLMDPAVVEKEFGVPPRQVVDVLALMGDASDNIPGVPGIGEKGAKELVRRFSSVEGCLAAARDEAQTLRPAYRRGLVEHAALALFSKELATIRRDAPVDVDLEDVWTRPLDREELRRIFRLLAFDALLRDVENLPATLLGRTAWGAGAESTVSAEAPATRRASSSGAASQNSSTAVPEGSGTAAPTGSGVAASRDPGLAGSQRELFSGGAAGEGRTVPAPAGGPASASRGDGKRAGAGRGTARRLPPDGGARVERDEAPPGGAEESAGGDAGGGGETAASGAEAVPAEDLARYRAVLDPGELARLMPTILRAPRVAVEAKAASRSPVRAELVGVALCWEPRSAIYVPIAHRYLGAPAQPAASEVLRILAPLLTSRERAKVGHDVKRDLEILRGTQVEPAGFSFDTMIAAFLIDSDRPSFSLDGLARDYLGESRAPVAGAGKTGPGGAAFEQLPIEHAAAGAGRDAETTLRLAEALAGRLERDGLTRVFEGIDMPLLEVLAAMELQGVRIDVPLLERLSREMGEQIAELRAEIHRLAGREFNVDSPRQLAAVLFDEIGLKPISRTAKSRVSSTKDDDLEVLAASHPLPARVRDYRALTKLRSTYVDALPAMVNPDTGRVHTSFHPTGAATGRLSSSDPNLQNIPVRSEAGRKIRAAFVPEPGWTFVSADYSQVELRVMAQISGDPDLRATFERGEDIHRLTASRIYGLPYDQVTADQRRAAKTINFGILYGMGPVRLARELSIPQKAARDLIESYFGRFPRIRAYIDETIARAEADGHVSTLFGRLRRFPDLTSTSRFQRQNAIRAAVNSTIQGTAADIMKIAMTRLHHELIRQGFEARILIQVHDELVLEAPGHELGALEKVIRRAMERVPPVEVPLDVEIASGENWLMAKK